MSVIVKKIFHKGARRLALHFDYDANIIAQVKTIPGRQYSATMRLWHLPDSPTSYQHLKRLRLIKTSNYVIELNAYWKNQIQLFERNLSQLRYAENTKSAYIDILTIFLVWWKNKPASALKLEDLRKFNSEYFIERKYSRSYQNVWVNAMKLYLKQMQDIQIDVSKIERPRKSNYLPEVLSQDEVKRLIDSYQNLKHKAIIMTFYSCGLRKSELINLKLEDIDSERMVIRIRNSKGAKDRDLPLPQALLKVLRNYFKAYRPTGYLFNGQSRQQYSARSIDAILKRGLKHAGIKKHITCHGLRHSYATHLVEQNINLRYIQDALGHRSSKTTEIYTKLSKDNIAKMISPVDFWEK